MAKVTKDSAGQWTYKCPGCRHTHNLPELAEGQRGWKFNGNVASPTFEPSILMRSGHHCDNGPKKEDCFYCKETADEDWGMDMCVICHHFVKDGLIQFLNDCTHHLAGQTVPMLEAE